MEIPDSRSRVNRPGRARTEITVPVDTQRPSLSDLDALDAEIRRMREANLVPGGVVIRAAETVPWDLEGAVSDDQTYIEYLWDVRREQIKRRFQDAFGKRVSGLISFEPPEVVESQTTSDSKQELERLIGSDFSIKILAYEKPR